MRKRAWWRRAKNQIKEDRQNTCYQLWNCDKHGHNRRTCDNGTTSSIEAQQSATPTYICIDPKLNKLCFLLFLADEDYYILNLKLLQHARSLVVNSNRCNFTYNSWNTLERISRGKPDCISSASLTNKPLLFLCFFGEIYQ